MSSVHRLLCRILSGTSLGGNVFLYISMICYNFLSSISLPQSLNRRARRWRTFREVQWLLGRVNGLC
jgi:hypothetical protein